MSITAADMLNGKVLHLLRILIGCGIEYCGKFKHHDFQIYLAVNDIDHTKKAQSS